MMPSTHTHMHMSMGMGMHPYMIQIQMYSLVALRQCICYQQDMLMPMACREGVVSFITHTL